MNKGQLRGLTLVNLRYANPQITDRLRRKGKNGKGLTRSLITQYLLSGVTFLLIYGVTMFMVDFSKMPGFFTYYVALFSILAFSQGISVIYNIFFESQDLPAYLPLPFRQSTIFLSKILVVMLTVTPFVFPMFVVFLLTGWRVGMLLPLTILLSVVLFLLILAIVFAICCLIVFGLTRTSFFKKNKKVVTTLLLGISMLVAVVGIMIMSSESSNMTAEYFDRPTITFLLPIFRIMTQPFSSSGLISLGGLLVLLLVLLAAIRALILPKLFEQLTDTSTPQSSSRRKYKANQNLNQLFIGYNIQLLKNPNLIMQVLSNSLIMPIVFIITFGVTGAFDLSQLELRFIGVVFLAGFALASMTVNQTSFISNLISLDQENFIFLQSLPISMHQYMQQKFQVGVVVQCVLTGVIALIGGFVFHLPLLFIVCLLLGAVIGTALLCLRFFARDYRFLLLDWTSITQLFNRGSGNLGLVASLVGSMIGSMIILIGYGAAAAFLPFWPLNVPVSLLLLIVSILWVRHYQKSFWRKFG